MLNRPLIFGILFLPLVVIVAIALFRGVAYNGGSVGYAFLVAYENYKVRGHQEFAANGVSQITPAIEMDQLFNDCRHFITYGRSNVPLFNSVAYFGDRYELTMQVPADIQSESSGAVTGTPHFYLNEVNAVSVSPSGAVGASFSRNLNFGISKWQRVYASGGDFSRIGFNVNTTSVPDFQKYAAACRPSN